MSQPARRRHVSKKQQLRRRRRRRQIFSVVCIVALAVLLIAIVVVIIQHSNVENSIESSAAETETTTLAVQEETTTEKETESATIQETTANELVKNKNSQIRSLVKQYFSAKSKANEKKLNRLVDNLSDEVLAEMRNEKEYIEEYSGINVYIKAGMTEDSYVVYTYYETKFLNIKTPAPSSTVLYVIRNQEEDKWYIHAWAEDGEIGQYIASLNKDDDVKVFYKDVNQKLSAARKKDKTLDEFCKMLLGEAS